MEKSTFQVGSGSHQINIATKMHLLIHKENKKYKEVMMQTVKIEFECWMTFLFFSPF